MAERSRRRKIPATFGGDPWVIVLRRDIEGKEGHWGQTYHTKREVHIDPRVFDSNFVQEFTEVVTPREIAIHEALHAMMPWMNEPAIDRMAKEMDSYLDDLDL